MAHTHALEIARDGASRGIVTYDGDERNGGIVRRSSARSGAGAEPGGVQLETRGGAVACNFRIVRERRRSVTCELLVANGTAEAVTAVAYPQQALEPGQIAPSGALRVPPFSSIAVTLDFPRVRRGVPRAVVALAADEARLEIEAERPRKGSPWVWKSAAVIGLACATAFGLNALTRAQPRVGTIVNPVTVTAGRPFEVAFSLVDASTGRYELTAADGGRLVAGGALPLDGGVLSLRVPPAQAASGYDLRIVAENSFGTQMRATHFVALATPVEVPRPRAARRPAPKAPLAVANLTLEHPEVPGGQPIAISYATKGAAGSVRLIDQVGTVRAEALLNSGGHSILIAPYVHDPQDFRVVVTAQLGAARAEAMTGLRVLDAPPLAGAAGGRGWSDAGPISVATAVAPNAPVPVLILRHEHDLRIALVADDGKEIDAVDVAPEDTRVSLWMPPHTAGRQFTVVVSFVHGTAAETRIVPLSVGNAAAHDTG